VYKTECVKKITQLFIILTGIVRTVYPYRRSNEIKRERRKNGSKLFKLKK